MDPKPLAEEHCYFIISPDPSLKHKLRITGKSFSTTKDGKTKPGGSYPINDDQLCFIKFGDEKSWSHRVSEYRTHNPSFWWRTIRVGEKPSKDKNLGKLLEERYLSTYPKPYEGSEWYAYHNTEIQEVLEELCSLLDTLVDTTLPGLPDDWWVSQFKNIDHLDKIFGEYFPINKSAGQQQLYEPLLKVEDEQRPRDAVDIMGQRGRPILDEEQITEQEMS